MALVVRLAHVAAIRNEETFTHPLLDAAAYHQAAMALAEGREYPEQVFWQPPGYPYFLGGTYQVLGVSSLAPRILQALLGAASATLVAAIGAGLFGPVVGLGAGLGAAFYGLLVYFDGELLGTSLGIFLLTLFLWLTLGIRLARRSSWLWALLAGVAGGCATLVNATVLPLVGLAALFARRRGLALLLGAVLTMAPVTVRNRVRGGEWVLISSNAGINLWIGNNPRAAETSGLRPGREWQAMLRAPSLEGISTASGASRFFVQRVISWARNDPAAFLRCQLEKIPDLIGGNEIPRNHEIYVLRQHSPVLAALLFKIPGLAFPWGVLLPLGVVGLAVAARRAKILGALLALSTATMLAFFVTARYRAPLVPMLLVFAAEGVRWFFVEASRRGRVLSGSAVIGLYLWANLGQGAMPTERTVDAELALAIYRDQEGDPADAARRYRAIVQRDPDYADAWYQLAWVLERLGDRAGGTEAMRQARSLPPRHFDTLVWMAATRLREGELETAIDWYRRAVALDPTSPLARDSLARAEAASARRDRARTPSIPGPSPDAPREEPKRIQPPSR